MGLETHYSGKMMGTRALGGLKQLPEHSDQRRRTGMLMNPTRELVEMKIELVGLERT